MCISASSNSVEQRLCVRAAVQYARLAARYSSDGLGLPDRIKIQIQRHYEEAYTTSQGWDSLEYNALTPSGRGNKDKIYLVDCKSVYRLDLAIARRKPEQIRQRQR
ncbi:MAG: hypothetical protein Q9168_007996 [Polycauliona sp. 1 TL-2023]